MQHSEPPLRDPENFRKWLLLQPAGAKVGTACPLDGQICPLAHFLQKSTGISWLVSVYVYWPERERTAVLLMPEWAMRFVRCTDSSGYHAVSREEACAFLDRALALCKPLAGSEQRGGIV
jgi:hypothetical protein